MRNPSPISTSSPRETTTSRPSASAASASSTAAALLLTTSAASAPVSSRRCTGDVILPRAACAGGEVVLEVRVAAAATSATRSSAASASGARPRFVCTTTPVALSDAAQARRDGVLRPPSCDAGGEIARLEAGPDLLAGAVERPSRRRHSVGAAVPLGERRDTLVGEQPIDRGQLAQRVGGRGVRHARIVRRRPPRSCD